MGLRQALGGYALAAIVIVVAGIWLPLVGVQLARIMGWSDSFVGTLFIALATSTPELATTLAAVRTGAIDLALGNILGKQPVRPALMNVAVIVALSRRPAGRVLRTMSWAGVALAVLYFLNAVVQYRHAS